MKRKSNHTTHLITTLNRVLRKYKRLFSKNTKGVTTSFCKKKTTLENRIKHLIAVVKKQTTAAGFATAMLVAAPFISQGQQFQLVSDNPFVFTSQDRYESPDLVDIDADGDLDLLYFKYQDPYLVLFENIGTASNPVFDTAQIAPFGLPTSYAGYDLVYCNSSFVDIDADGDYDMYLGDGYGLSLIHI